MMDARKRLTPIERLARDICWADDRDVKVAGFTKAQWWADLADQERGHYLDEAERFTFLVRKLGAPEVARILVPKKEG